jgi:hypothetical protein
MSAASALFSEHFVEVRLSLQQLAGAANLGAVLDARQAWSNRTALEAACCRGDVRVVRLLLSSGADAGAQLAGSETALHRAVRATLHASCEEWQAVALLEALLGSEWEETGGQLARALRPARSVDAACTLSLQDSGARAEEATPLYLAAHLGSLVAVRVLLLHGANPRHAARLTLCRGEPPMADLPLDVAMRRDVQGQQSVIDLLRHAASLPTRAPPARARPHARPGCSATPVAASPPPPPPPVACTPSPLAVAFSDPEVHAKLEELRELHWSDRFFMDANSESLSKKEALLALINSHPRCAAAYSLLARDLPSGETVRVEVLSDTAVGTRELLLKALELDDADLMALRSLVSLVGNTASEVDMPHCCGPATQEALCREIYYIRAGRSSERRFSRAAGKARLARIEAAREAAEREAAANAALALAEQEAAIAAAVAAAEEAERRAAAAAAEDVVDEEVIAEQKTALPTLLANALRVGGIPETHVRVFVAALLSRDGDAGKLPSAVLASLTREQQNTMRDAVALLQDVLHQPDKAGTLLCARAAATQTKFQNIFPPKVEDVQLGDGAPGSDSGHKALRLGDVPTACRPYIALAHLLSDSSGSWADDAAAHLVFYCDTMPLEPSPVALLALALLAHFRKNALAAAALMYAFAHWGADAPLFEGGATAVGPCAAHWMGPVQRSDAAASGGAEFRSNLRSGSRSGAATGAEEPAQRSADEPEEEWKVQKLQQARLPAHQQLRCPALDKIMDEFDGLRAVKHACLQLYVEVKQARVRKERTGTELQDQLSDNPLHFVFLGNVRPPSSLMIAVLNERRTNNA